MARPEPEIHLPPEEFQRVRGEVVLLDVRTREEFLSGHIPGARHLPLDEIPHRAHELPRDRLVVCVCRSGRRSLEAARLLLARGFAARSLAGGLQAWRGPVHRPPAGEVSG